MATNIYDDEFLLNLAVKLQDSIEEEKTQEVQQPEQMQFKDAWALLESQIAEDDNADNNEQETKTLEEDKKAYIDTEISDAKEKHLDMIEVNLNEKEKEFVNKLEASLQNIANLSDKEVKQIYNDLKVKFYADKNTKKQFKASQKMVKAMIKSDKKRTNLRFIKKAGKYSMILGILGGAYNVVTAGWLPIMSPYLPGGYMEGDIASFLQENFAYFQRSFPDESKLIFAALGLGVVAYATGKGLVKLDDVKTLRRLMVQVCGEDMTTSELQALKKAISQKGNGVKEAMITYPLRDYGKSPETLAQERLARTKEEKAETEVTAKEEKHADDELTM